LVLEEDWPMTTYKIFKMSKIELTELCQASNMREGESMEKAIVRASDVWKKIALRLGFDYKTARQVEATSENMRIFEAVPLDSENNS
jgi:hypothetical protein